MSPKTFMTIAVGLVCCTLSGCDFNSRIAMPSTYWEHGLLAVVGGLAVFGLIFLSFINLGEGGNHRDPDCQTYVISGISILIVAGLLLQALPHTTSGIQFIPLPPWFYNGWLSRIVSGIVWLFAIFSSLCALSSHKNDWGVVSVTALIALILNALLSFSGPPDAAQTNDKPSPLKTCEDKITEWEKQKTEQSEMLGKLLTDKESLVSRIRDLGLNKQDLMAHRVGRPLVEELEQLTHQIAKCQNEVEVLEAVLENAKSKLRIFERQAMLHSSTEEDFKQMSAMEHEMEAELRRKTGDAVPGSAVHLNKLLDEVLGSNK